MIQAVPPSPVASEASAAIEAALALVGHSCVAVRSATRGMHPAALTEAEQLDIGHASPERRAEFALGRTLAREALHALGHGFASIRRGEAREPLWPGGVTGSISHTGDLGVAVAALESNIRSLGVDVESHIEIEPELWPSICSPRDLHRIEHLPAASRAHEVARVFSAKEAAFKCQFPLTRRWIDFAAVSVSISRDGTYRVIETAPGAPPLPDMHGAVLLDERVVFALARTEATHAGPCASPLRPFPASDDPQAQRSR